jgi:hypothetical protein
MGGYADEVSSFNVNTNNTIALKMIRQLAFRQTTALRAGLVPATRYISTTPARYSIIGSAKDVLHKANKKIGEVAAEGIEKTQHATPHSVGDAAQKVNKKTGEVLAEGIEKTQQGKERLRVSQNAKGYDSLQDKGSKTETEQNRPDDAV